MPDQAASTFQRLLRRPRVLLALLALLLALLVLVPPRPPGSPPAQQGFQLGPAPSASSALLAAAATPAGQPGSTPTLTPEPLVVYISGAVQRPGVYRLPPGARIIDVLQSAGGAAAEAELEGINLAARLVDAQHIAVPYLGAAQPAPAGAPTPPGTPADATASGRLNLNHATAEELELLPRIGPATARRIVDFRAAHGAFTSPDELLQVEGIGPGTLAAIRDLISVGP